MADEKKGHGVLWALLLLLGGGTVYVINKAISSGKINVKFPSIFGTKTASVDKYAYGNSTVDGKGTASNSNSDIAVTISDIKSRVITGQYKAKYNDYIFNISITNKLSTSITIEHIVLLFYMNGTFKGFYEFSPSSFTPIITLKYKSSINNTVSITQGSYTRFEDMSKINLVDTYFEANPQKLSVRKSEYNSGYHWEGADIIDPVTGAHSQNPNMKQVQDYSPDYVVDRTDKSYLEDSWMNKYTLTVKGFVVYRKNENDVWDGGNTAYVDLITNHSAEATQPYTNRILDGISSGSGGSGSSTTSKSKLGVSNFIN